MDELLSQSLSFPTVVFSLGLGVSCIYWLMVVVGAVDTEMGHGGHDVGGIGDVGHVGHADIGHADIGHADIGHADVGHAGHGHDAEGFLDWLGLGGVPIMLPLSFVFLFGWATSLLAVHFFPVLGGPGVLGALLGIAVLLGSVVAVTPLVRLAIGPFKKLFHTHHAVWREALVGRRCVVTSQRVGETFGQAEIVDYGAGVLVEVRCREPNDLVRGATAVVFAYDAAQELFRIVSLDAAEAHALSRTSPPGAQPQ